MHSCKFKCILFDLYKQGEVIADETLTYWSTNLELVRGPQNNDASPFQHCQDLLARKFPDYTFDSVHRIVPGSGARVANFEQLKEILLSKDLDSYDSTMFLDRVFLDGAIDLADSGNQIAI